MLIKDIQEVKSWIPFSTFDNLNKINAYLLSAEATHIVPILGEPLYSALQNKVDTTPIEETDPYATLLLLCQAVIVNYGMYTAAPMLNVTINQSGGMTVTTNENTVAASKDRTDKLMESLQQQAHQNVERLLLFLEQNSLTFVDEENKELWKESDYYYYLTDSLFFTAKEFNKYVFIGNSRLVFHRLIPSMRMLERTEIRSNFGDELVKKLIQKKIEKTWSDTDKHILVHLQTALALFTLATDQELSKPDTIHGLKPFDARTKAASELVQARQLIMQHPADYPEYPEIETTDDAEKKENKNPYMFRMGGHRS